MAVFEMVKYHNQTYPADIPLRISECSANFDITSISADLALSMHTEYSYGKRKMDTQIVSRFPTIVSAQKDGIPQLWKNEQWAYEFAHFVFTLADGRTPEVIEIHPPFADYCDFDDFIKIYTVFEKLVVEKYPNVIILIENRCGSVYHSGKFLISKNHDVEELCRRIVENDLRLKIAYDVPQIYTAHNVKKPEQYTELIKQIVEFRNCIGGVHLWGKRKSETGRKVAHCGDLNTYFDNDNDVKMAFLKEFNDAFNDGVVRKMVLEVNSGNDDLLSIVDDLRSAGVEFV